MKYCPQYRPTYWKMSLSMSVLCWYKPALKKDARRQRTLKCETGPTLVKCMSTMAQHSIIETTPVDRWNHSVNIIVLIWQSK